MAEQSPRPQGSPQGGPQGKPPASRMLQRVYTVTFTLPKLLFSLLFGVVGISWIFIFGIMIGRGHNPETKVPKLARIMPSALSKNGTMAPLPPSDVITPGDLQYHNTLKGRPVASAVPQQPVPKPVVKPAQPKPQPVPPAQTRGGNTKLDVASPAKNEAATQTAKPLSKQEAKPEPKASPSTRDTAKKPDTMPPGSFAYVYQVAAFKESSQAEVMKSKLQNAGFKISIEKQREGATTWYKLLTPFRGRPEDTRELKERLSHQGIIRPIMRSKKPLP